jgi:hypothetical protein
MGSGELIDRTGTTMAGSGWAARVLAACTGAATVAVGITAVAAPAQAAPLRDGPRLLTVAPSVIFEDSPQWVHAYWLGTETVCDFRLTASGPGVRVGYPANTATYTSFYRDDSLGRLEPDYTALNLTGTRAGTVPLRLHMSYTHRKADGTCTERVRTNDLTVRLSVLPS